MDSNRALMDFLQREKWNEKDECKLIPFQTLSFREFGCVKCGRIRRSKKKWQVRVVCQKQNESLEEEARTGSCKDQTLAPAASVL